MQKIYGKHAITEALKNEKRVIYEAHIQDEYLLKYIPKNIKIHKNAKEDFLVAKPLPFGDIHEIHSEKVLILDQITDPQNLGAIIRSCACFAFKTIIVQDYKELSQSPTMIKVASGGFEHVEIIPVVNIARSIEELKKQSFWCYGITEEGDQKLTQLSGKIAIVIGAEGKGLRPLVKKSCDGLIAIPTNPNFPTLNASHAATVVLYTLYTKK